MKAASTPAHPAGRAPAQRDDVALTGRVPSVARGYTTWENRAFAGGRQIHV